MQVFAHVESHLFGKAHAFECVLSFCATGTGACGGRAFGVPVAVIVRSHAVLHFARGSVMGSKPTCGGAAGPGFARPIASARSAHSRRSTLVPCRGAAPSEQSFVPDRCETTKVGAVMRSMPRFAQIWCWRSVERAVPGKVQLLVAE